MGRGSKGGNPCCEGTSESSSSQDVQSCPNHCINSNAPGVWKVSVSGVVDAPGLCLAGNCINWNRDFYVPYTGNSLNCQWRLVIKGLVCGPLINSSITVTILTGTAPGGSTTVRVELVTGINGRTFSDFFTLPVNCLSFKETLTPEVFGVENPCSFAGATVVLEAI